MQIKLTPEKKEALYFPVLPNELNVRTSTSFNTYNIIKLGQVKIPRGRNRKEISWKGILPGSKLKKQPFIQPHYKNPKSFVGDLSEARDKNTKCRLLVTGTSINMDVYVSKFDYKMAGGVGSYTYEITLIEATDIVISTKKNASNNRNNNRNPPKKRQTPNGAKAKTYKVKSGDCLWNIALRYYGDGRKWTKIRDANKNLIKKWAKKYNHGNTVGGTMIYPGQKLTIPK